VASTLQKMILMNIAGNAETFKAQCAMGKWRTNNIFAGYALARYGTALHYADSWC
jgi:hypothetical protein